MGDYVKLKEQSQKECPDPLSQYNYVVSFLALRHPSLRPVSHSPCLSALFHRLFASRLPALLFYLAVLLLPLLNWTLLLLVTLQVSIYFRGLKTHRRNLEVEDPFDSLIISPEICQQHEKDLVCLEVDQEQLRSLGINPEYKKSRQPPCQVILYNHECYSKFQEYPRHQQAYKCVLTNCVLGVSLNMVLLWQVWLPLIGYH